MKRYTVEVTEDSDGNAVLPLPTEMLEEAGWKEGDVLEWKDNHDGTYSIIKKVQDMEWVLVETIISYRMRYMVQVPKGNSEWALDTVTMEQAKEFSQKCLGEQIIDHRVVSEQYALDLCNADNSYISSWTDEKKIDAFFTKYGEKVEL